MARVRRWLSSFSLLVLVCMLAPCVSAQRYPIEAVDDQLPMNADQVAASIGLSAPMAQLRSLLVQPSSANTLQVLMLREQILEQVTAASLQVDATTGQIDNEIAEVRELQNYMAGLRDRQVEALNLAGLAVGGVVGTASAALGLTEHGMASGVTGLVSGAVNTVLSTIGLRIRVGERDVLDVPSNMLARLFDQPENKNDFYPQPVWTFLTSVAPNEPGGLTRQQQLIHTWVKVGRIPPPEKPKGHAKILQVTSTPADQRKLTIGDLDDRQAMLYDLRARFTYMKRDLAILLVSLTTMAPAAGVPAQP